MCLCNYVNKEVLLCKVIERKLYKIPMLKYTCIWKALDAVRPDGPFFLWILMFPFSVLKFLFVFVYIINIMFYI